MIQQGTILPSTESKTEHDVTYKFVAKIGHVGDFAVYCGRILWDNYEVASFGDKIPEEEARKLFPELEAYTYRN